MIIEIKDLPEGRKVKRILVDISFEDNGISPPGDTLREESRKSVSSNEHFENIENVEIPVTDNTLEVQKVKIPSIETREKAPVPAEMLNIEF